MNLTATYDRLAVALETDIANMVSTYAQRQANPIPPTVVETGPTWIGRCRPSGHGEPDAARTAIEPEADIHASKEFRAHLAGVLTERAIRLAYDLPLNAGAPVSIS